MTHSNTSVDVVHGNKIPLYLQVAQALKQRVRTGDYKVDRPLPSIRQLGREFGVTASVVHRAVRDLEKSGIVTTQHGKGMVIATEDPCEQAAILFGFIHPYVSSIEFNRFVLGNVNEAFEDRANLVLTRTSKNDPAREREAANHLIANGVKGLLLWGVTDDTNGQHFTELAQRVPIVLIDRFMKNSDLPAVVVDHYRAGQEICQHLLAKLSRKRLLVLMDNLEISAYDEMISGFEDAASALGRPSDLTVLRYPMLDIVGPVAHRDFSGVQAYRDKVQALVKEGGYDALFTNHGPFLDRVIIETGLIDELGDLQLATLSNQELHTGSKRFCEIAPLQWDMNVADMVAIGADILQELILNRRKENKVIRLPMRLLQNSEQGLSI